MMLTFDASDIVEYDRRRSELSSALVDMEYDNISIEIKT